MGSAAGTSPGRLVETDDNFNIISEWPEDIAGTANTPGENFNPHGLTVDWKKNIILTSDFVIRVTILKPSLGIALCITTHCDCGIWILERSLAPPSRFQMLV
jgi:hypothetical protein